MSEAVKVVANLHNQLGEGAYWSARENAVYWVDILTPALHRYSLDTALISRWPMPEKIGWIVERRDRPGFIAGLQSGFVELTLDPVTCKPIVDPEPHLPGNRMNDAQVDAHGRLWAGTMDVEIIEATGSLYRLDTDLKVTRQDTGYLITNGPTFCPVNARMYHTETGRGVIYRFDFSADGNISGKTEFIRFPGDWGSPDGMTVDDEGGLWVAHWGAGCISRFTAEGELDRRIALPASQITSCVFAGKSLDRLFVTSAAKDKPGEPLAGALFEVDAHGFRGVPQHLFAG